MTATIIIDPTVEIQTPLLKGSRKEKKLARKNGFCKSHDSRQRYQLILNCDEENLCNSLLEIDLLLKSIWTLRKYTLRNQKWIWEYDTTVQKD